jgi:hypothetical protein
MCEKLAVADQKLIVSIMFKVLAPGQRNDCPTRTKAIRSVLLTGTLLGLRVCQASVCRHQVTIKLFDAAASSPHEQVSGARS